MILLQKAIQGIIALRAGFVAAMTGMAATTAATGTAATTSSSAFALYTANTRTLQAAAATATPTLVGLRGVLASLASIGTIAIAVNIAVYGIQAVMQARAELDRLRGVRQAGGAAATFGGSAPAASKESARKTLAAIEAERKKNLPMQAIGAISGFGRGLGNTREQVLAERERFARGVLALPTRTAQTPALNAINTPVGATVGGGSNGRKGKTDAEKAAEKAAREAEKLRQELERSLEVGDQLGTQFSRQAALLFEGSEIERKRLQIQFDFQDRAKQIAELKNAEQRTNLNQLNAEIQRLEIIQLQTEELKKQAEEAEKLFKQAMEGAEFGVAGQGTVASGLSDAIAKLKEDLNPIKLQIDAIVNGANAIGSAFGQAFQDVATGAKSTQEALADAFESIGKAFVSMAAEIIAKQMTLIILQTILSALSAGGSALGTANKNLTGAGALKTPLPGLKVGGYAEGGLVTSPTLAMIGEGGEPEYVIPFSKMDAAMANYADGARNQDIFGPLRSASVPFAKTPERLMTERSERETVAAINNPKPLDVRFESQVINGVEYVTAEQHRKGMSQAAERGRALTLAALQNSVKTRKRVGMT